MRRAAGWWFLVVAWFSRRYVQTFTVSFSCQPRSVPSDHLPFTQVKPLAAYLAHLVHRSVFPSLGSCFQTIPSTRQTLSFL